MSNTAASPLSAANTVKYERKINMEKLRIFVASPSDMASKRIMVGEVASLLKPIAEENNLILEVVDWSSVIPGMGRPEQVILDQVKPTSWDVFIGILWTRFGTPPNNRDPITKRDYMSGTEEEFLIAYRLWEEFRRPRILMYRCIRNIPIYKLDTKEYDRVENFFKQFNASTGEHPGLYQEFKDAQSFQRLLFNSIQKIIIEYGKSQKINDGVTQHLSLAGDVATDVPTVDILEPHQQIASEETFSSERKSASSVIETSLSLDIPDDIQPKKHAQQFSRSFAPGAEDSISQSQTNEQNMRFSAGKTIYFGLLFVVIGLLGSFIWFSNFAFETSTSNRPTQTLPIGEIPNVGKSPTPYIMDFKGDLICHSEPNTSSKATVIGQHVKFVAQHEDLDWLYIEVLGYSEPCWVEKTGINDLDNNAILVLPVYAPPQATITPNGE